MFVENMYRYHLVYLTQAVICGSSLSLSSSKTFLLLAILLKNCKYWIFLS